MSERAAPAADSRHVAGASCSTFLLRPARSGAGAVTPRADPLRRIVGVVALLNLAYFGVEFTVAYAIGAVSLFADSIDFLEDTAVNFLVFVALAWSAQRRARAGQVLAGLLLLPVAAVIWALAQKWNAPVPPPPQALGLTGLGALAVNLFCAGLLARYRNAQGSLTRAAFLSARNDALGNVAVIAAGLVTALHPSIWPDVAVGVGIAALNGGAAWEVWMRARRERLAAR